MSLLNVCHPGRTAPPPPLATPLRAIALHTIIIHICNCGIAVTINYIKRANSQMPKIITGWFSLVRGVTRGFGGVRTVPGDTSTGVDTKIKNFAACDSMSQKCTTNRFTQIKMTKYDKIRFKRKRLIRHIPPSIVGCGKYDFSFKQYFLKENEAYISLNFHLNFFF